MGRSRGWRRLGTAAVAAGLLSAAVLASGAPLASTSAGDLRAGASAGSASQGPDTGSQPPNPSDSAPSATDEDGSDSPTHAVARLIAARSDALAARDRAAWARTVADPDSDEGLGQLTAYDNLVALGVFGLTATDPQPAGTPAGSPGAAAPPEGQAVTVLLGHAIPGFDRAARVATRTVTVVRTENGWRIERDRAETDRSQVWDLPGLRVVRSDTVMVAGNAPLPTLQQRLADAEAGQARLTRLFGTATPAVLVVAATAAEAAAQLGFPSASGPGQVAATTDGAIGPTGTAVADRVVLHPDAFARVTGNGARVVVAHELTHVASRAAVAGVTPLWLSEGLAEYVAWSQVSMPAEESAARLLTAVRTRGAPAALPGPAEFDPAGGDLATAYQASWLAVRRIAADHGDERLMRFYRAAAVAPDRSGAGSASAVEQALRTELGLTMAQLVARWRAELDRLAGR